jgi:hypothetical protein
MDIEELKAYRSAYREEEKEILVLTSAGDYTSGPGRSEGEVLWSDRVWFLAYVDSSTNDLKKEGGCIVFPLAAEETTYPNYVKRFKQGCIYRLRVREPIDKTVGAAGLPASRPRFLLVETIEEDARNDELLAILAEYKNPARIVDELLGEFRLKWDFRMLRGESNWMGETIQTHLIIDPYDKTTWTKAKEALRALFEQQA